MYDSLLKVCDDFHLYVFAFNDLAYHVLSDLKLKHMTVISLKEFEDPELLKVKPNRSRAEYCWTSTSSTILYVLNNCNVENCTYLDSDLYFYSNPKVLIEEVEKAGKSVLITGHRYTRRYDQSRLRGKYCVQFMYFKNDLAGREVLEWWRARCLEWCYAKVEDGKFGDQKYLDDWTTRFAGVHELHNLGGGVAPWNCQQYRFEEEDGKIYLGELKSGRVNEVVFFHFHGLKIFNDKNRVYAPRSYMLNEEVIEEFYEPYYKALMKKGKELKELYPNEDFHGRGDESQYFREKWLIGHFSWFLRNVMRRIFPPLK